METVLVLREVNTFRIGREDRESFSWDFDSVHNISSDSDFTDDEEHVSVLTDDSGHESSCHSDDSVYFSEGSTPGEEGPGLDSNSSGYFDSEGSIVDDSEAGDEDDVIIVKDDSDLDLDNDDIEDPFDITNIYQPVVVERVFNEDTVKLETQHADEYMKHWFDVYFNTKN